MADYFAGWTKESFPNWLSGWMPNWLSAFGAWVAPLLLTAGAVFFLQHLLTFPASVVGSWLLPRNWGLASPTYGFGEWLWDDGKALGLSAGIVAWRWSGSTG